MRRMFFHNCFDCHSEVALSKLEGDWMVFDVFGKGDNIPEDVRVSKYPYIVDKELKIKTEKLPDKTGSFVLEFDCIDYNGSLVADSETTFFIFSNGYSITQVKPENGRIAIPLSCSLPGRYEILINGEEYLNSKIHLEIKEEELW